MAQTFLEFQLPNPLNKPRKKGEEEERERHAKSEEGLEKEGGKCVRAVAVTRERSGVGCGPARACLRE